MMTRFRTSIKVLLFVIFLFILVHNCAASKKAIFGGAKKGGAKNGGAKYGGKGAEKPASAKKNAAKVAAKAAALAEKTKAKEAREAEKAAKDAQKAAAVDAKEAEKAAAAQAKAAKKAKAKEVRKAEKEAEKAAELDAKAAAKAAVAQAKAAKKAKAKEIRNEEKAAKDAAKTIRLAERAAKEAAASKAKQAREIEKAQAQEARAAEKAQAKAQADEKLAEKEAAKALAEQALAAQKEAAIQAQAEKDAAIAAKKAQAAAKKDAEKAAIAAEKAKAEADKEAARLASAEETARALEALKAKKALNAEEKERERVALEAIRASKAELEAQQRAAREAEKAAKAATEAQEQAAREAEKAARAALEAEEKAAREAQRAAEAAELAKEKEARLAENAAADEKKAQAKAAREAEKALIEAQKADEKEARAAEKAAREAAKALAKEKAKSVYSSPRNITRKNGKPINIIVLQTCNHPSAKYPSLIFNIHPEVFFFKEVMHPLDNILQDKSFFVTHTAWSLYYKLDEYEPTNMLLKKDVALDHLDCKFSNTGPDQVNIDDYNLMRENATFKAVHKAVTDEIHRCRKPLFQKVCRNIVPKTTFYNFCATKLSRMVDDLSYMTQIRNGANSNRKFLENKLQGLIKNNILLSDEDLANVQNILDETDEFLKLERMKLLFNSTSFHDLIKRKVNPKIRRIMTGEELGLNELLNKYIDRMEKFYDLEDTDYTTEQNIDNRASFTSNCIKLLHDGFRYNNDILKHVCENSHARATEMPHMFVREAENVLEERKNVYFVVLYCDPRHIIFRQKKNQAAQTCASTNDNINSLNTLSEKYPGKFYKLRLEDLHNDTKAEIENIYHFLGLHVSQVAVDKVANSLKRAPIEGENLKSFENHWKQTDMDYVAHVDEECRPALEAMKYPIYEATPSKDN